MGFMSFSGVKCYFHRKFTLKDGNKGKFEKDERRMERSEATSKAEDMVKISSIPYRG